MKKILFIAASAIAMFAVASCNKDSVNPVAPEMQSFEAVQADLTRTTIDGVAVKWKASDAITVFDGGTTSAGATYTTSVATPSSTATFSGTGAADVDGTFYAFYPANSDWFTSWNKDGDGLLRCRIAPVQYAVKNDFPENGTPMFARGTGSTLTFEHLAGYVKFTIGDASPTDIIAVTITENAGAKCAGVVTYQYATATKMTWAGDNPSVVLKNRDDSPLQKGDYYVAVRPRIWKGITLTFLNSSAKQAEKSYASNVDLSVGKLQDVGVVRNLDFGGGAAVSVGDLYKEGGVNKGVVMSVGSTQYVVMALTAPALAWCTVTPEAAVTNSSDGETGTAKVVAFSNYSAANYPAIAYCKSLGDGWYLPGTNEWKGYMADSPLNNASFFTAFDKTITDAGGDSLGADPSKIRFWSSTTTSTLSKVYYNNYKSTDLSITNNQSGFTTERPARCAKKVNL